MPHHRCTRCGREFATGSALRDHLERRHPPVVRRHTGRDPRWWVVSENPAEDLPFSGHARPFRYERTVESSPTEGAVERPARPSGPPRRRASGPPPVDIEERTDRFVLSVDLPGRTTRDIDVTVRGPRVRLVAPPPTDAADRGVPVRRERRRDGFERTFRLPERVDESRVSATYFDGTLRVDLPKLRPGRSVDVA